MGNKRSAHSVLVRRSEVTRPLGTPRLRREDNIKLDVQAVGRGGMDWITLTQNWDRGRDVANVLMYVRIPQSAGNLLTCLGPVSSSGRTLIHGVSLLFE
jgi:hypothetical protein